MTLWRRIADGVWLCAASVGAFFLANVLLSVDHPVVKMLGSLVWLGAIGFSGIFFGIGFLIVAGGLVMHVHAALRQHKND